MLLPALQAHVFQRLKAVLSFVGSPVDDWGTWRPPTFLLANERVIDHIITLVQYVYFNTTRPGSGKEPLRHLICSFIAQNLDDFHDEEGKVLE